MINRLSFTGLGERGTIQAPNRFSLDRRTPDLDRNPRRSFWPILLLLGGAAVVYLTVATVPWNMDEFAAYHRLACWQASQRLNTYTESCSAYPIQLGPLEYHRSFSYAGIASSVLLWPLVTILDPFLAHYVMGVAALLIVALGFVRTFCLRPAMMLLVVLFFPLTFTLLHDAGPVRIGMVTLAWTPVLVRRFLDAQGLRRQASLAIVVVVLWMIATEDKPFFVYLMPGLVLLTLAGLAAHGRWRTAIEAWRRLSFLFVVAPAVCLAVLVVMRTEGQPYLFYLAGQTPSSNGLPVISSLSQGVLLTFDWPFYAHRVSDYSHVPGALASGQHLGWLSTAMPVGISATAVLAVTLTLVVSAAVVLVHWQSVRRLQGGQPEERLCSILTLASAASLGAIVAYGGGWASHHFVYMQLPLLGLIALRIGDVKSSFYKVGAVLFALTVLSLVAIWLVPERPSASREIASVMETAIGISDPSTVINCGTWGCYYPYSLANRRNVPVVYAWSRPDTQRLSGAARARGRRILHVCLDCDLSGLRTLYPSGDVRQVETGTRVWRLFEVDFHH